MFIACNLQCCGHNRRRMASHVSQRRLISIRYAYVIFLLIRLIKNCLFFWQNGHIVYYLLTVENTQFQFFIVRESFRSSFVNIGTVENKIIANNEIILRNQA